MTTITAFSPKPLQFSNTNQPAERFVVQEGIQWVIYKMKNGHAEFVRKLGVGASKPGLNEKTATELQSLLPSEENA